MVAKLVDQMVTAKVDVTAELRVDVMEYLLAVLMVNWLAETSVASMAY